jgi:N-acetylglucosaminyldiphosphoundecaprenol N-acetyl-beta-D-mannosaminyltransferase
VQRNGLEWLYRLSKEPRRLAYRYLVYNPLFILYILAQISGVRRFPLL